MNKFNFNNRTAVITGGAQGFGLDIAKRFLNSGAKVIIWDINEELLKSAVVEVNHSNLNYNIIDISNYSQIEKTVSEITSENNIDILTHFYADNKSWAFSFQIMAYISRLALLRAFFEALIGPNPINSGGQP